MEAIHAVGLQCCGILSVCFVCQDQFLLTWVAEGTQDLVDSFVLTSGPLSLYGCTLHPSVMVAAGPGCMW